ncbi:hypothetical protein CBR_g31496 [Chara braunii]|uniref:Uncharacterized protein n=1 Tax=Chara braunii TaxID=69332 RepID=A0A388LF45_CHABU|nr:hypothetical protein CBR_g31496 [Chara braunii]|eukprot:GBG80940.1 hypothetical protein CBR_g31496 [Chara braunii]
MEAVEEAEELEAVELSVMVCDDPHIQLLNKEWRGVDEATDVLSFAQEEMPEGVKTLLLGDVVISVDTAQRQAQERKYSLHDEMRVLLVHGLLHCLGYDHEQGEEEALLMAEEEERILSALGWKGHGLINNVADVDATDEHKDVHGDNAAGGIKNKSSFKSESEKTIFAAEEAQLPKKTGGLQATQLQDTELINVGARAARVLEVGEVEAVKPRQRMKAPFRYLFCDMDGTLLNSKSKITKATAKALRAAMERGVTVILATGKGLRVYGVDGIVIHSRKLQEDVCTEAFNFSAKHKTPLVAFAGDQCLTLFDHPLVDALHTVYYEPKAEIVPDVEELVTKFGIQKLLFYETEQTVSSFLRPHWTSAVAGRASITQAVPDMLEILPLGGSKGVGVSILLDHLDVPSEEVMAIGDGENDMEMLQLAGFGVAMANGAAKTLAVADALVGSNDEDGVVEAIERFIL